MVTVSVEIAGDVPLMVTGEETVHVAPSGQPLVTFSITIPINPFTGLIVIAEVPDCPGAERSMLEGFAAKPNSVTLTEAHLFTRLAALTEPSPVAKS